MRTLWISIVAMLAVVGFERSAEAQTPNALVVATCGNQSYTATTSRLITVDITGKLCTDGTGGGGGGLAVQDLTAFVPGTDEFTPSGCFYQTTPTNSPLTSITQGMAQCTAQRAFFVNLRNSSGTEIGTSAAPISVAGTGTAGSANANVLTVQGIASMTPLLSNPGTAANWAIGATGSAPPANAQYMGVLSGANMVGLQVSAAGSPTTQSLTIQGNGLMTPVLSNPGTAANWGVGATAASVPANAQYTGFNSSGNLVGVSSSNPLPVVGSGPLDGAAATLSTTYTAPVSLAAQTTPAADGCATGDLCIQGIDPLTRAGRVTFIDPCTSVAKTTTPFTQTSMANIIPALASNKNYICSILVNSQAAEVFSVVESTTTACGGSPAALVGSLTAANGISVGATSGWSGSGGGSTLIAGKTANSYTCILQSGSNRLSGYITWVQAP